MVCMNCVVSWVTTHTPTLVSALLVPVLLFLVSTATGTRPSAARRKSNGTIAPPVYGPSYLPRFMRGLLAVIRLGKDEDAFLFELNALGPIVYVPWPLGQYVATDATTIDKMYEASARTLTFLPTRKEMQVTTFGTADEIAHHPFMEREVFPTHARGMTKQRLERPLERYSEVLIERCELLKKRVEQAGGSLEMDLYEWVMDTMFWASTTALFGDKLVEASGMTPQELYDKFRAFDDGFPLLAFSSMPRSLVKLIPLTKRAEAAQTELSVGFGKWADQGMPGVEDDSLMATQGQVWDKQGLPPIEKGRFCAADFWALQANAPFAACWLLTYVLQAPSSILESLRAEAKRSLDDPTRNKDGLLDMTTLSTAFPLATSCVFETLRLTTSTYSIRTIEADFHVVTGDLGKVYELPKGDTKVISATRIGHIDGKTYEDPMTWDAERFYDGEGGEQSKSKLMRKLHAFGGGISMCEGRHFAAAELKALLAHALTTFDFELPRLDQVDASWPRMQMKKEGDDEGPKKEGWLPPFRPDRAGLGVRQMQHDVRVTVKLRS